MSVCLFVFCTFLSQIYSIPSNILCVCAWIASHKMLSSFYSIVSALAHFVKSHYESVYIQCVLYTQLYSLCKQFISNFFKGELNEQINFFSLFSFSPICEQTHFAFSFFLSFLSFLLSVFRFLFISFLFFSTLVLFVQILFVWLEIDHYNTSLTSCHFRHIN